MTKKKSPRTIELLTRLPKQIGTLVKAEINNAKAEVSGRIRNLIIGIVLFVLVLMILFWVIATLLTAAVAGLSTVWPVWLSALAVSGAGILTMLILAIIGYVLVKKGSPVPSKTIDRVSDDISQLGKVKESVEQMAPQPGKKGDFK